MTQAKTIEQRLQQLEDKHAILELKYRYLNACDEKQPDLVTECFMSGTIDIDFGHIGQFNNREDFVDIFKKLGCHAHIVDMHHAKNPIFLELSTNSASIKICMRFQSINTQDKTSIELGGYYLDGFQKTDDDQWLINRSSFTINSVKIIDFSGESSTVTYSGNCMPS
ncbi:MAG TPA: nuclear transport factor 2 family protein [Pseudomonadales bacterium]|nr:nuclear transport factor 2 family protein [Gammaproteobacteria bacterium]HUH57330.1 nuclear transport factor 2 family protein [Pseudomonadales bacterium]